MNKKIMKSYMKYLRGQFLFEPNRKENLERQKMRIIIIRMEIQWVFGQ